MIEVSMITMNCASAMRASAAQRRGFAVCMRSPFRAAWSRLSESVRARYPLRVLRVIVLATPSGSRLDGEGEVHAALVVLGDVAVRHPLARMGDLEQEVDGLAGRDQHRVLPDEVGLGHAVAGEDQEAAGAMDVEGMVHR